MKRLALILALALAGAPASAEACKLLTPQVKYCLEQTSWAGIEGERVPNLGAMGFRNGDLNLTIGVLPDFARAAWDGTPEGIGAIVEAFSDNGALAAIEPTEVNADKTEARAAFAPPGDMIFMISVLRRGTAFALVQTIAAGTEVSDVQRAAHDEAVAAVQEVTP